MAELYPYQEKGVRWLMDEPRRYLADEMGLGKTVQVAVAAWHLGVERAIVVAPASTLPNWGREWARWNGNGVLDVVSYSKLVRLPKERVYKAQYELVVLDEAHYCKSPGAKRTKAALRLAKRADRAWLLSGTPMPNHPGELWAPIRYLWPEIPKKYGISRKWDWFNQWCLWHSTPWGAQAHGVRDPELLRKELEPIMKRRRVAEVLPDLPPLRLDVQLLPSSTDFERAFAGLEAELGYDPSELLDEEGAKDEGSVSRVRRFLGELKAPMIAKLLVEELGDGAYQKLVVMAHHRSVLDILRGRFREAGHEVYGFDGDTPSGQRQQTMDAFEGAERGVFVAQQTAAGVGINLQSAREIVLVEPSWSPEDNAQAIKRIHRIGQDHPCRARIFAVKGTLDDSVMDAIARKTRMIDEVINTATEGNR